jgi:ornithine cyclodeaminase/alanine dehydrogenase-like protein (mu-crystallin family)
VEVDPALFKEFDRVVCDTVDLVLDEAGDAYQAVSFHGFERDAASDLADVVSGAGPGRMSADEMTLFKSVGTGAQDLVVAARLLALAETRDVGTVVGGVNSVKPG